MREIPNPVKIIIFQKSCKGQSTNFNTSTGKCNFFQNSKQKEIICFPFSLTHNLNIIFCKHTDSPHA